MSEEAFDMTYQPTVKFGPAFDLGLEHGRGEIDYQRNFDNWKIAKEYLRGYNRGRLENARLEISLHSFGQSVSLVEKFTEEVRTTSSTGGQKGVKPQRHSLIPIEALDIMARLYGFGAEKYAAHNWRKGYDWSKSFDSLIRHANAFWGGEDLDEETGLPHLAGAAFHCFTLMVFMQEHPEFDDRYKKEVEDVAEKLSNTIPNPAYFDGTILVSKDSKQERIAKALYENEHYNTVSDTTWEVMVDHSERGNEFAKTTVARYRSLSKIAMAA